MKSGFSQLDKTLGHRVRLHIMSVLVSNEHYDFNSLKELLEITDGNLSTHLKALERDEYIIVEKTFVNKKTNTRYIASSTGRAAFWKHLEALENLIKQQKS